MPSGQIVKYHLHLRLEVYALYTINFIFYCDPSWSAAPFSDSVAADYVALNSGFHKSMALDGVITSPHRRTQTAFSSTSSRKNYASGNELGSFSTVVRRHRFLLTALALLAFLCTIYLYFAITLGAADVCMGLTGSQKALCQVQLAKDSIAKGKLKFM